MKKQKNIKRKSFTLRDLLKEDIATTVAVAGPQEPAPFNDISLDQKVDHFLIQYERESVPIAQQFQQESRKPSLKSLMGYLFEAPGDEAEDDEPAEDDDPLGGGDDMDMDMGGGDLGGGDLGGLGGDLGGGGLGGGFGGGGGGGLGGLGGDDGSGGGGGNAQKAQPVPTPKINVSNFSKNVARLANEYQSLLDPKRVILNRARAYLEKNYNPEIARQMMEILDKEYNLTTDPLGDNENEPERPIAAGAAAPIG